MLLGPVSARCFTETQLRRCRPQLLRQLRLRKAWSAVCSSGSAGRLLGLLAGLPPRAACTPPRRSRASPRQLELATCWHARCPSSCVLRCRFSPAVLCGRPQPLRPHSKPKPQREPYVAGNALPLLLLMSARVSHAAALASRTSCSPCIHRVPDVPSRLRAIVAPPRPAPPPPPVTLSLRSAHMLLPRTLGPTRRPPLGLCHVRLPCLPSSSA